MMRIRAVELNRESAQLRRARIRSVINGGFIGLKIITHETLRRSEHSNLGFQIEMRVAEGHASSVKIDQI